MLYPLSYGSFDPFLQSCTNDYDGLQQRQRDAPRVQARSPSEGRHVSRGGHVAVPNFEVLPPNLPLRQLGRC